jgi:hypothetical protein
VKAGILKSMFERPTDRSETSPGTGPERVRSRATQFLDDAGRLQALPRRRAARLAVLDTIAGEFQPGVRYPEDAVNDALSRFHPDYCTLRRVLVEEEFLERRDGIYWRIGGTFDVD